METIQEWEQKISTIINDIHTSYPELVPFIAEMPNANTDNIQVNVKKLEEYHSTLQALMQKYALTHEDTAVPKPTDFPSHKSYPASEDIYQQGKLVADTDPADISKKKSPNQASGLMNEQDFTTIKTGKDLDIPGSELDDAQENIGSEDEENNYYSLGGDNHNDLEEDKG